MLGGSRPGILRDGGHGAERPARIQFLDDVEDLQHEGGLAEPSVGPWAAARFRPCQFQADSMIYSSAVNPGFHPSTDRTLTELPTRAGGSPGRRAAYSIGNVRPAFL